MRTYKSYEKEIFKELYKSKEVNIYSFYQKYKLSPAHVSKFILNCKQKKLVDYYNGVITITENGKLYIEENKNKIYLESSTPWKVIPKNMKTETEYEIEDILELSYNDIKSFLRYLEKKDSD